MKARVKATGHIVDVELSHYLDNVAWYITKYHASYSENELEFIDEPQDYWNRLEHQYAGMAMQGLMSYTEQITPKEGRSFRDEIVDISAIVAHALVEKMKEERK